MLMNKKKNISFLFLPLAALILGIYAQSKFVLPFYASGTSMLTTMFLIIFFSRWINQKVALIFVTSLFFFTGGLLLQVQKNLSTFLLKKYSGKVICIYGTIADKQEIATNKKQEIITIAVEQVKEQTKDQKEEWVATNRGCSSGGRNGEVKESRRAEVFSIMCNTRKNPELLVGDVVCIDNIIIKKPTTTSLSKNPAFSDYLIKEGILASIFTNITNKWTLICRPTWSLNRWIWKKRDSIYKELTSKCLPAVRSYFSLIFLGNKQQSKDLEELRVMFSLWGLSHYLARSGLHIVLFILFLQLLLQLLPIYLPIKRIFLILACVVYNILSWSSMPFLRAYTVFLFVEGGRLFSLQTSFFHILTFVCLITLLFNPMQLFFLDFQLSFALTFALAFAFAPIKDKIKQNDKYLVKY